MSSKVRSHESYVADSEFDCSRCNVYEYMPYLCVDKDYQTVCPRRGLAQRYWEDGLVRLGYAIGYVARRMLLRACAPENPKFS